MQLDRADSPWFAWCAAQRDLDSFGVAGRDCPAPQSMFHPARRQPRGALAAPARRGKSGAWSRRRSVGRRVTDS
jgi:hypothetical protein